jgi:hypothetical protein
MAQICSQGRSYAVLFVLCCFGLSFGTLCRILSVRKNFTNSLKNLRSFSLLQLCFLKLLRISRFSFCSSVSSIFYEFHDDSLPSAALFPQTFERIALCFLAFSFCNDLLSGWRTARFLQAFEESASCALVDSLSSSLLRIGLLSRLCEEAYV